MSQQVQSPSFNINSKFFIQQLDNLIIQIVQAIAIEYKINPDPDAKEAVRKILLTRANELMSEESKIFSSKYIEFIRSCVKHGSAHGEHKSYEFIKLMGMDNV